MAKNTNYMSLSTIKNLLKPYMNDDLLTEVLRHTGLSTRRMARSELPAGVVLRFPCPRSMGLHMVVRGPVYLHLEGAQEPLALESGDIAVMARGTHHALSLSRELGGGHQYLDISDSKKAPGQHGDIFHVLSGAYQFWHAPLHPLFEELPDWYVLRADEMPRETGLAATSALLAEELRKHKPGAGIVTHSLLDVVFALVMRQVISRNAGLQAGWCQGAADPQVGRALALMQENVAYPWTLDELARQAGMSRTSLAERFRSATRDTPLNHLRTLRMQRAVQLLTETRQPLDAVAAAVGYQDAFGFSKVFKRTTGSSPRDFRQQDAAERESPLRFASGQARPVMAE